MKRSTKNKAFLDRFIKRYTCSARNHPKGWAWYKRRNRKDVRLALKKELDDYNEKLMEYGNERSGNS